MIRDTRALRGRAIQLLVSESRTSFEVRRTLAEEFGGHHNDMVVVRVTRQIAAAIAELRRPGMYKR